MTDFDHFIGTQAALGKHALNLEALQAWLQAHIENFRGPVTVEIFKGGQSNPTYKLVTPSARYVMRMKPGPIAQVLPSAHAIEREFAVMRALRSTAVPVPEMLALCEDESVLGRAFYIMEYREGRVLWNQALPGMSPQERTAIYQEMNRVIAALHTVDYVRQGLVNYGKPGNYFERQIKRWSQQYLASMTQPIEEMERLMEWLPAHIPSLARDDRLVGIVHGDYRMDNLMFEHEAPKVCAVLDWELSTLGHPFADFSYHCMTWHIAPGAFRGIGGLNLADLGIPSEDTYIRQYCDLSGLAQPQDLKTDWNFFLAYNLFRLAAILQGIAKRVETGTASSAQAIESAAGARPLAWMAWQLAQRA
jgi:aminoglycoside phosphotransferase (APT) family kinase protein